MIFYTNIPGSNIVEICIAGEVTGLDSDRIAARLKADMEKHGNLRILQEVRNRNGTKPSMFWKNNRFARAHENGFTHAAVVTDAEWLSKLSESTGRSFPGEVKTFKRSQLEEARKWLKNV